MYLQQPPSVITTAVAPHHVRGIGSQSPDRYQNLQMLRPQLALRTCSSASADPGNPEWYHTVICIEKIYLCINGPNSGQTHVVQGPIVLVFRCVVIINHNANEVSKRNLKYLPSDSP